MQEERYRQRWRGNQKFISWAPHNSCKNEIGEKISINGFWETKEEAIITTDQIEMLIAKKVPLSEIAILFRVAAHTRSFEDRLISIGLPYNCLLYTSDAADE